jgi:hypothetical protein
MKKANVLVLYLVYFIIFIEIYSINITILQHKIYENQYIYKLNQFSLIESAVLIEIIQKFHTYKMEDFVYNSELGIVYIYFIDESTYIYFDFESSVYARLDYDLVFDSCYNYELINEGLFPVVDKIKS